jgi:ribosomal protein L12E/L44/L45/RPP1/RPP2
MRHLAAAMLLALAGKTVGKFYLTLDEKSIKDVLTAAGVKADDAKVTQLVNEVKGKDVLKVSND